MEKSPLYQKIAADIRHDILEGRLKSGDALPSIREMMHRWSCTSGTVQHAYADLAREGLLTSQPGKGTRVSSQQDLNSLSAQPTIRLASLVHRAEAFLLDCITAGYSLAEIQSSINIAADRWRELQQPAAEPQDSHSLRFAGSHDMVMLWLSNHIEAILPGIALQLTFAGSLHGLMMLAEGKCDLAGCHLWDEETQTYNGPYLRRLFPGEKMVLIHLAKRKIGFIVAPGNPLQIQTIEDLSRPGVRFVNRQSGSGTRVWLDIALAKQGIDPGMITGYAVEKNTHSQVAQEIAEGRADVGIGLENAASLLALGFVPLVDEEYDLVTYADTARREPITGLIDWLGSPEAKEGLADLAGYDFTGIGKVRVVA